MPDAFAVHTVWCCACMTESVTSAAVLIVEAATAVQTGVMMHFVCVRECALINTPITIHGVST